MRADRQCTGRGYFRSARGRVFAGYSEKAAAIGLYAVASGIYTHLGLPPNILGSEKVTDIALNGLEQIVGASFVVNDDPEKAADLLDARIRQKRQGLGLQP